MLWSAVAYSQSESEELVVEMGSPRAAVSAHIALRNTIITTCIALLPPPKAVARTRAMAAWRSQPQLSLPPWWLQRVVTATVTATLAIAVRERIKDNTCTCTTVLRPNSRNIYSRQNIQKHTGAEAFHRVSCKGRQKGEYMYVHCRAWN